MMKMAEAWDILTEADLRSNSSKEISLKTSPMMDLTAASLASGSGGGEICRKVVKS